MRVTRRTRLLGRASTAFLVLALALFAAINGSALAHGHVTVGDYDLALGFHSEPPLVGELNALDLFVTDTTTGEPVSGLEQSLQAEIIWGTHRRELELEPQEDIDGAYTASFVPTRDGDYTWHIWGTIEDTPVDVSMLSGPDTFEPVAARSELSFPDAEPSAGDLQAQAASASRTALLGLIVGGAGLILGLASLVMTLRQRSS